jgi:putative SOS response-associated peptidase YedK
MPVILPPEAYDRWLDPGLTDPGAILPLLRPYPADTLRSSPVSTRVNNPRSDDPACVEPLPPPATLF